MAMLVILVALTYTWAGYPALLWMLRLRFAIRPLREKRDLTVSLIVAVYNEEAQVAGKLENCLALEYPRDRLEILVASDGSTDSTESIVEDFAQQDGRIHLLRSGGRMGKSGIQNLAVAQAQGEILLFTDAETRMPANFLELVVEDFADPQVGLVAPTVHFGKFGDAISQGQGAYWRFELSLRQMESDLGILATASGAAMAVRRALYRPIPPEYGDDCVIPLDVRLQGYRVTQDPRIVVSDEMPHTIEGEVRARVRMTARNWGGMLSRPGVLNPLRFPATAWGLVSHKLLRWLTPFFLAALFLINGALVLPGQMRPFFLLQCCFYVAALVGWRRSLRQPCKQRIFAYPFAFCLANLGFLLGLVRYARAQTVTAYK